MGDQRRHRHPPERRRLRADGGPGAAARPHLLGGRPGGPRTAACEDRRFPVRSSGGRMADSKVWFITGCSKGFGRIWAEAALERGDKVAATARDASTLEPLAEKYGDDVLALALDVQDMDADFAAVTAGPREVRPARRGRQQRRLRAVRDGRGGQRRAGSRPDRDQRLRRPLGDQGGAADPPRAGLRPHHPGVLDRRRHRLPGDRPLPRVEVGAGGVQPVALAGGRRPRHQRDAGRAAGLLDRLGRPLGDPGRADARLRRRSARRNANAARHDRNPATPTPAARRS